MPLLDPISAPAVVPLLTSGQLRAAYSQGYFPWPDSTGQVQWHRPDPRAILPLDGFHCSRSLARTVEQGRFEISMDRAFDQVMAGCADRPSTWITPELLAAYSELHAAGQAHSVEAWHAGELAGGVYGVALGGVFFAESMFHRQRDASKVALFHLVQRLQERGFTLCDIQVLTPHTQRLGGVTIPAREFRVRLIAGMLLDVRFA